MPSEVRVKKVKAYPIPARIVSNLGPSNAEILKLNYVGCMAEIGESKIQTGDKLEISFELPVVHLHVKEQGVVVKLYNQFAPLPNVKTDVATVGRPEKSAGTDPKASSSDRASDGLTYVMHLAEIHFKPLSADGKKRISQFLKALSQAPSGA